MFQRIIARSHRWTALVAFAVPWLLGCGISHQEKTPMPKPVLPQMSAQPAVSSPEPAPARLQTATFALG